MNKITAMTIATSLGTGSAVTTVDALNYSIEESNQGGSKVKIVKEVTGVEATSSLIGTVINTNSLNVRSTPDTSKASIGKLSKGQKVTIISQETNGWYKINFNGKVGYVSGKYISVQKAPAPDYTITNMDKTGVVTGVKDTLNVRNMPNTKGTVLFKLNNNETIKITGKASNGWYRIVKNGVEGFASGQYIKEKADVVLGKVTNISSNDTLNVREKATTKAKVLYTLKNNASVEILEELSNNWLKISYNGKVGYASGRYIEKVSTNEKPETTVPDSELKGQLYEVTNLINIRKQASWSADIIKVANIGDRLDVVEIDDNWAKVYINGVYAYAPAMYLTKVEVQGPQNPTAPEVPQTTDYVVRVDVNMKDTNSWDGNNIKEIKAGETVKVVSIEGEWAKIYDNGVYGYIPAQYISNGNDNSNPDDSNTDDSNKDDESIPQDPIKPEAPIVPTTVDYIVTGDINMRTTASWSGDIMKVIKTGEIVKVVEINGTWAKIYDNGIYGYVPAQYLINEDNVLPEKPQEPEQPDNSETPDVPVVPDTPETPDTPIVPDAPVVPETPEQPEGTDKPEEKPEEEKTTVYMTTADINMRTTASWSGNIIKVIKANTQINVVEITGDWAKIVDNGAYGYVPAKYVMKTEVDADEVGVSYTLYPYTMDEFIDVQYNRVPSHGREKFASYINPMFGHKYEFLELNKFREINVDKLNALLKQYNAGVLKGQAQAIYDAAKKKNIDPLYFVAQSIHETGYGKSTLASGVTITEIANPDKPIKNANGDITGYEMIQLAEPTTVYNLYGIGAFDNLPTMPNRALILGTTRAYNEGWTSVEKAIHGAADFVSSGYINSTKYNQNTLYKIRYNPSKTYIWHQYATTPWYARDIAKTMEKFDSAYEEGVQFTYDKPKFKESKSNDSAVMIAVNDMNDEFESRIGKPDITKAQPWLNK